MQIENVQAVTIRLPTPTYERLRQAAFDRRVHQAYLIREAISVYLDHLDEQPKGA